MLLDIELEYFLPFDTYYLFLRFFYYNLRYALLIHAVYTSIKQ